VRRIRRVLTAARQKCRRGAALSHRAWHDAIEEVWRDVRFGLLIVVVGTLIAASLGAPLDVVALANLIAVCAVPFLFFLGYLGLAVWHPDRHRDWSVEVVQVIPPGSIRVRVCPRKTHYEGGTRAEVIAPDGSLWREPYVGSRQPRLTAVLSCSYPEYFPGAPAVTPGVYKFRWLMETLFGGWREILYHEVQVTPQELQP
jgi:hypothetical protein